MVGSTPTTSQGPSTLASSISLARISRPPTRLMRWRACRSLGQQQLAGPALEPAQVDPPAIEPDPGVDPRSAILRIGTKRSRPAMRTTAPTTGG